MTTIQVDGARLWERLTNLGSVGGAPDGGVTRLSYTAEHAEAVQRVAGWMQAAGMEVAVDPIGNLIGRLPGRAADSPTIALGSHLDTVPSGGRFDGALGVLGGIECVAALRAAGVHLTHALAVVAFAEEEGNQFGVGCLASQVWCGGYRRERWSELSSTRGSTLASLAADFDPGLPRTEFLPLPAAYLELHVEQGPELERRGLSAAAVSGIAGISRVTLTFSGQANHAGTTPMDLRRDALWGAAETVLAVRAAALATSGRGVATVGRLTVEPGATNVIPGRVAMSVELRSADQSVLSELETTAEALAHQAASRFGLSVSVGAWHRSPPITLDPRIIAATQAAFTAVGLPPVILPSWAGHDAKILAAAGVPSGMIFVPSAGGVSHSPAEFTPQAAVATGVTILAHTVLHLDRFDHA